ncbi:energy transducer TonB [Novacetimonas maltaceti]|uniref:energy transducer TonB n=1 Tax=Novacetimonas maltaceti TaxID=1203393 RepID=UPI000D80D2F3|nr:energy transducer TonB [Novacetimonas maltaceti]PYD61331.1 energy transducer TonB [Novacetimonas maltaceti]
MVPRPRRSERVLLRRSILISGGLHVALLLAVVLRLPVPVPPEPPPPPTVEMEFTSDSGNEPAHKGDKPAPKPAPAPAPEPNPAPPAPTPPEKEPNEEAAPPPPPPPPMPPPQEAPAPTPDTPTPPKAEEPSPDALKVPPQPQSVPAPASAPVPPSPQPEENAPPKVQEFSHITQPNETKKAVPDTHSLLATLDSFRADQKQTHPPKARANPAQGGAPNGGGTPDGDITQSMSAADQKGIGNAVRRCYSEDTAARNYAQFVAHLVVTVDATGTARIVEFAPQTQARMDSDPSYRALAERARDAVLSPTCAKLPIPKNLLGQTRQLKFVFRP